MELQATAVLQAALAAFDGFVFVLDQNRQLLAVNDLAIAALHLDSIEAVVGRRPGEVLGCANAARGPDGCATGPACGVCGANRSVVSSQETGEAAQDEVQLAIRRDDGRVELREFVARAAPCMVGEHALTILSLRDVTAVNQRAALERTFLHDLNNLAGAMVGWSDVLAEAAPLPSNSAAAHLVRLCQRLGREVADQALLANAEEGVLVVRRQRVRPVDALREVQETYRQHPAASRRIINVLPCDPSSVLETDPSLLDRVLGNMMKNALEATSPGGTVTAWHEARESLHRFVVQNGSVIPDEIAARLFTRMASTKPGAGRGLGTYSMRLFGERYLGGKVGFVSSALMGTQFFFDLPGG